MDLPQYQYSISQVDVLQSKSNLVSKDFILVFLLVVFHNPTLAKCEDETHTPKVGDLESSGTPESLKFDSKGQNTSPWDVLGVIGKVLKCRCKKGLALVIWTSAAQVMGKRRAGSLTASLPPDH